MARKRKPLDQGDDLTFATMPEPEDRPRKVKAEKHVDPWDAVAAECPCRASAAAHRHPSGGIVRVHVTAYGHPVLCLQGALTSEGDAIVRDMPSDVVNHNAQWNIGIAYRWRKSDAYAQAELSR